ncbi:MAG: hypothetical protein IPL39_14770 [Opitutaceae bacterium]|nr:hypothetical protein [Opitutaceae bacterium]
MAELMRSANMKHPTKATGDWRMKRVVFDTGAACVAVAFLEKQGALSLAMRWNEGQDVTKDGKFAYRLESPHGESTGWVILPWDFASVVGKTLIEKQVAGARGFDSAGYRLLKKWLLEREAIHDGFSL